MNYVHGYIANICNNGTQHLHYIKITRFYSFKSAKYRTTNCNQLHCKHVIIFIRRQRWWAAMENLWQAYRRALAWEQECTVLNFCTQESKANPPSKTLYAAAWFTWYNLSDTFCWLSQQPQVHFLDFESVLVGLHSVKCNCLLRIWRQLVLVISISSWMTGTRYIIADTFCWLSWWPHVCSWNLKISLKVCIKANGTVSSHVGGGVFPWSWFQVGWLEPDAFFAYTFWWLSWWPHVHSWNSKVSWKVCIQANATVSSEFVGDVFLRFRFQSGWLEPDAFLPTLFVGFLDNLMSVLGAWNCLESLKVCIQANATRCIFCRHILLAILTTSCPFFGVWKCPGKSAFRQMRLSPLNLVAMCSHKFEMHVGQYFVATEKMTFVVTCLATDTATYIVTAQQVSQRRWHINIIQK